MLTLDPWTFARVENINFTLYSVASGGSIVKGENGSPEYSGYEVFMVV